MATGVRFTISGSDTDFTTNEVQGVEIAPMQSFILQERQNTKPNLYFEGNRWFTFGVNLMEYDKDTLAKITTVLTADVEMTFYPYFAFNSAVSYSVILIPDNIIKIYHYGERAAWVEHQLRFLHSS